MKTIPVLSLAVAAAALLIAVRAPRPTAPASPNLSQQRELDDVRATLRDVRATLRDSNSRVAEISARLAELERRYAAQASPASTGAVQKVAPPILPSLASGSYTVEQNAVVYGKDAELRIWSEMAVRSPNGVMVSNLSQTTVVGDLTMQSPRGTVQVDGAVIDVEKKVVTGREFVFRPEKKPYQTSEPTSTAVTTPPVQQPRQP